MAKEPTPDQTSSEYDAQVGFWNLVNAILGGETAIKAGGEKYLPKFAKEKQAVYDYRLANSPFTNIYADISKNLASKPFSKDLGMVEGTPDRHLKLAENIDGQGNNLHVFAAQSFKSALDKGIDWILVDYTKAKPRPDGKPLSIADEQEQGLRPYWVHVPTERLLAVYFDFVNGVEIIHHARIRETATEIVDFQETCVERIRVFERMRIVDEETGVTIGYAPATWALWEASKGQDGKTTWAQVDGGNITIGVIPLVPVCLTKRQGGSWIVDPPLRDLAHMQIAEYRQEANLEWIKIMTCYPMVCVSGMAPQQDAAGNEVEVTVGPNTVFMIPQNSAGTGPAGEVTIVEPDAQSIVENRNQLELTRKEMRDLGMQPMTQSALTVVTTANVSKKASSAVQAWVFLFKDAIELALKYTAMWMNDKAFEPEIVIHTDFAVELEQGKEVDALLKAEGQKIYSKQTVREEFRRRNIVANEITDEEEEERIAKETEAMEPEEDIDPRTGQPIKRPEAA